MKIKTSIIVLLFLLSTLSFVYSNGTLCSINNGGITNHFYSDYIAPLENLTWNVVTFDVTDVLDYWTIKPGKNVQEGDVIRITVINDPDEISLANYTELFTTTEIWAEFYLNDELLGNDTSQLNLNTNIFYNTYFDWLFILPTTLEIDGDNESTFQHYYDAYSPHEFSNENGTFEVILTNSLLTMRFERYLKTSMPIFGKITLNQLFEVSYNIEYGYMDMLVLKHESKASDSTYLYHLILQNELSTQQPPTQRISINWFTGMVAFIIIGLTFIYIRRR